MKYIHYTALLFVALAFTMCHKPAKMQLGPLTLSTDQPKQGETITVTYIAKDTVDSPVLAYTVMRDVYLADLEVNVNDSILTATFTVPDSATSLAFNFSRNRMLEQPRDYGYTTPVFGNDGKPLPGALFGEAVYLATWGDRIGAKYELDSIIQMVKTDIDEHPEYKNDMLLIYGQLVANNDKAKADSIYNVVEAEMAAVAEPNLKDYSTWIECLGLLKNSEKTDSVKALAIEKYPTGVFAAQKYLQEYVAVQTDNDKVKEIIKEFAGKFQHHDYLDMIIAMYLSKNIKNGNTEDFDRYIDMMQSELYKVELYESAAMKLAQSNETVEKAETYHQKTIESIDRLYANPEYKPYLQTKSQFLKTIEYAKPQLALTDAAILFTKGEIKQAIEKQESGMKGVSNPEFKENYLKYLMADGQYKKVQELATSYKLATQSTPQIEEYLKEAYSKNDNEQSYEDFIAGIENATSGELAKELREKMVDEPLKDFTLKDKDGNAVTLSELKGKVVVLDLWANWCGPCKASFPGMQMAVDKFKNDPNVVFLFVNTFENDKLEKRIDSTEKFMKDGNLSFHVIYDEPGSESNNFKVATGYGIKSIPAKLIVGTDGRLKFRSTGYSGNNDQLVKELEVMIQLAKM